MNLNKNLLDSNSQDVEETIRSLMQREGDELERNYRRYRSVARDVFRDLNLKAIKYAVREFIEVDKKTNSITVPKNTLKISSISIVDDCGKIKTLIIDTNIIKDIVDVSSKKDCDCECGCKGNLCGQFKHYEPILTDSEEDLPNGDIQTFTSVIRKLVYPDGSMVISKTVPTRVYEEGQWVRVELITTEEHLCKLQVKKCGCIVECEDNHKKIGSCINADDVETECGCSLPDSFSGNLYNYNEFGDRIEFPSNFTHDKVLLRRFIEFGVKDIRVPLLARRVFMLGLKHFGYEMDDSVPKDTKRMYETKYNNGKDELAIELHKCSLAEIYSVLTPKRTMP